VEVEAAVPSMIVKKEGSSMVLCGMRMGQCYDHPGPLLGFFGSFECGEGGIEAVEKLPECRNTTSTTVV
jgi:hypothetical protein